MKVTAEILGIEDVNRAFDEKIKKVKRYTAKAMTDVTLDLLGKAVERAPVDTGDLRGSGYANINNTTVAKGTKDGVTLIGSALATDSDEVVGEVGFTAEYALVQHEDLSFNHPQGGQAKYLEQPFDRNTDKYIKYLEDSVDNAVGDEL